MRHKNWWIALFLAPTVFLFLLIYVLPLGAVFVTSLFDYRLTTAHAAFVGLDNYRSLLHTPSFRQALWNTLLWVLLQSTVHVGLGVLLAVILFRRPKGWRFLRTAYMVPSIISNAALGLIFLHLFNPKFGLVNGILNKLGLGALARNWLVDSDTAFPAVTLIWIFFAGYTTTLVLAEAESIDPSILEAAKLDGASDRQVDWFVLLPLLRRTIGVSMILSAAYMLQMFDILYLTTNGGPGRETTNLALLLYGIYQSENNYGYANTVGVCIVLLGLVFMTVIARALRIHSEE